MSGFLGRVLLILQQWKHAQWAHGAQSCVGYKALFKKKQNNKKKYILGS